MSYPLLNKMAFYLPKIAIPPPGTVGFAMLAAGGKGEKIILVHALSIYQWVKFYPVPGRFNVTRGV